VDEVTGLSQDVVTLPPGDEKHQPAILVRDSSGKVRKKYLMPSRAHLMVKDGDEVQAGDVLAKIPRETTKTKDITGGLPRVVELFETRKPKDPAVISEVDGVVRYGDIAKGMRKVYVESEDGKTTKEYSIPRGVHINVQEGDHVKAGEALIDGPLNLHDCSPSSAKSSRKPTWSTPFRRSTASRVSTSMTSTSRPSRGR
jgi:DNA-directed RNA polymerase subunit beta'